MRDVPSTAGLHDGQADAGGKVRATAQSPLLERHPAGVHRHGPRPRAQDAQGHRVYKIPSLRGLWDRPRLLHDASIVTLEELFDEARLSPDYERKGWSPPGVTKGPIPGLEFLTKLPAEDKRALIAFLRSL